MDAERREKEGEGGKEMEAELWSKEGQERITLERWLLENGVKFKIGMSIEELRQLYIDKECGR